MMRRAWALAVVALPAALVFAAACGGGSSGSQTASPNASTATAVSALRKQATVLPNGTVVVNGTPLSAAQVNALAARGVERSATQRTGASGTPGAPATSGSPAPAGTPTLAGTPAAAATDAITTLPPITPGPGGIGTVLPATPANVAPTDGFSLAVPANASGDFDVTVNLAGSQPYFGFNVALAFDASLLEVKGVDGGSALGSGQSFCPPAVIAADQAALGCVLLTPDASTATGSIAVYHFHAKRSGSSAIHIMTYAEGGESYGTFLIGHSQDGTPQPLTAPTHDANITVSA